MIDPTLVNEAVEMLRAVEPKTFTAPVYICDGRDIPDGRFNAFLIENRAITGPMVDIDIKDHLEAIGQWLGRGFATVVFPENLESRSFREEFLSVVLHESVHCLQAMGLSAPKSPIPDIDRAAMKAVRASLAGQRGVDDVQLPAWCPWHGADFIRASLHMEYRASAAGFPVRLGVMGVAGETYGLDDVFRYSDVLRDELWERGHEPLLDVLNDEPPSEFIEFFGHDIRGV